MEATTSPAGREAEAARRAAEARRIREYRERSKTGDTELLTKEAFSQAAACEHPVTICSVDDAVAACAAISVEPCTWQEFHEFYRSTRRWLLLERRKASVGATNVAGVEKLCAGVMKLVEHAVPVGGVESALCTMLRESRVRPPGRTRDKLLDLLADIVRSYEHALNIVVCNFIPTLLDVFNDINTKETRGQARPILRMLSCLVRTAGDLEHGSMGDLVKAVVHCLKHEEGRYGDSSRLEIRWTCVRFLISVCHTEALTGGRLLGGPLRSLAAPAPVRRGSTVARGAWEDAARGLLWFLCTRGTFSGFADVYQALRLRIVEVVVGVLKQHPASYNSSVFPSGGEFVSKEDAVLLRRNIFEFLDRTRVPTSATSLAMEGDEEAVDAQRLVEAGIYENDARLRSRLLNYVPSSEPLWGGDVTEPGANCGLYIHSPCFSEIDGRERGR